mgnify:FL=1
MWQTAAALEIYFISGMEIMMSQLKCDFRVVGSVQTNCYFLSDTNGNCVVVDPGEEAARIIDYIEKKDLKPVAILLTHGHFDHIGAVDEVREKYGIKVYAAAAEKETLQNTDINLSSQFGAGFKVEADEYLNDGQEIELLGEKVRCLLTPGHTKGGMCYYFTGSGILFSGDTLFQQSVGRTDFPGGSMGEIVRSIREKLFVLPDYVRVYTGHGMMTNIKDEKMLNPFAVE